MKTLMFIMPTRSPYSEAEPGSLPRQTLVDLMLMRDFFGARDAALHHLFGRSLKRSALRDEIIRSCVIEFGLGRIHRISYYQVHCSDFGSDTSIKNEIRTLVNLRVFFARRDPENAKALLVSPTTRLISFYKNTMSSLVEDIEGMLFIRKMRMSVDLEGQ